MPRLMSIGVELILRSCCLLAIPKYIFSSYYHTCSELHCEHIQLTVSLDIDMDVLKKVEIISISRDVAIVVGNGTLFISVPHGAVEKL